MSEKKGNVLTGKSRILAGSEVHDQAANNKQSGDRKSNDNAQFLRFKYIVNFFHFTIILKLKFSKCIFIYLKLWELPIRKLVPTYVIKSMINPKIAIGGLYRFASCQ